MFEINYRIVHCEYDDFDGQHGFFQIKCNGFSYGEIYPREIEMTMEKVSLINWFERLAKVIINLMTKEYVVLSDVESYNIWIEFQKKNEKVIISIVKVEKEQGSHDIEFSLKEKEHGEWMNQVIEFKQFKEEVIEKGNEYIKNIIVNSTENLFIDKLKQKLGGLV